MSIYPNFLTVTAVAISLANPAVSQEATADTVVSTVNGTDITLGHMIVLREGLPEQYQNLPDAALFDGLLDQLVQQTVLAQKAGDPSALILLRLENEQRSLLAGTTIQSLLSEALTEDALLGAYAERFSNAESALDYNASHILVETEEEAVTLLAELNGGADFAELAQAKSTGPSGPNGGELGWFGAGMMVKQFEDVVVGLDVGKLSEPVQTQFGWHVIRLNDSREIAPPAFEEVRGELAEEMQQLVIEKALIDLTAAADISRPDLSTVDPALMRDLGLVQN